MRHDRYSTNLVFVDLLFNIVVGIAFLFIISFLMIRPPVKKEAIITPKAEYIITMEWSDKVDDDMDLWVLAPDGARVGFSKKEDGLLTLERDDRGITKDTITVGTNTVVGIGNREVVSIRGIVPGEYLVSAYLFNKKSETPIDVTVEVVRLNPYYAIYTQTLTFTSKNEAKNYYAFIIDISGKVVSKRESSKTAIDDFVFSSTFIPSDY